MSEDTGSGVVVYGFDDGKIVAAADDEDSAAAVGCGAEDDADGRQGGGQGRAVSGGDCGGGEDGGRRRQLLVADNLSDDVLLMDAATGEIEKRFDLSENDAVPSTYPVALAVSKDGTRRLWRCGMRARWWSWILKKGTVGRKLALLKPESRDCCRGRIRVRWRCRRMGRRCMWRWRIGMRWRR